MEPTELTAAVVSGWATAWAITELTQHAVPGILAGLLVCAAVAGNYRRRWQVRGEPA